MDLSEKVTKPSKRGRGRPLSFDREALIEKVMHMFWERGFEAVSLNEIAAEAGLTRASLYNCFGSKEALFEEAMALYFKNAPDARLENLPEGQSVGAVFFAFFDEASMLRAKDTKSRGCMAANCINELASSGTPTGDHLRHQFLRKKHLIKNLLDRAVRQEELPATVDTTVLAALMLTFMAGFSTFSKTTSSESEMRRLCEMFLNQIGFSRHGTR